MVYCALRRFLLAFVLFPWLSAPALAEGCDWIAEGAGKPTAVEHAPAHVEICRAGFLLSFNPETKLADWVMERLTPERLDGDASREEAAFKPDPALPVDGQASLADYRSSGYDRGHLAPAGDMKWDEAAMNESFYLTNVAPQVGVGFNRGVWAALEAEIRGAAKQGELAVATGPVFFDFTPVIGNSRIPVPDAFFKAVLDPATGETRAWLIPNRAHLGARPEGFTISLARLESLTGYDFFPLRDAKKGGETAAPFP